MLQTSTTTMALISMIRKVAMPQISQYVTTPLTPVLAVPLLKFTPVLNFSPLRTYMDNFNNERTHIKPVLGWMHQNRARQAYRTGKGRREYIPSYSEVKRVRSYGWERRMSTEGGRKQIMRRILRGRDHLAH